MIYRLPQRQVIGRQAGDIKIVMDGRKAIPSGLSIAVFYVIVSSDPSASPSALARYGARSFRSASCPSASDSTRSGQSAPATPGLADSSHSAIPNGARTLLIRLVQ